MIELGTDPKVNALIEKYRPEIAKTMEEYHIGDSDHARGLIARLIYNDDGNDALYKKPFNGDNKNLTTEEVTIRKIIGHGLENDIVRVTFKKGKEVNFIASGKKGFAWHVAKVTEVIDEKSD